jgi:hypothetical protein
MGKKGIALEHGVDVPVTGRHMGVIAPVNMNFTPGTGFKTGNQSQNRCLATAGRTEKGEKFPFDNIQGQVV